MEETHSLTVVNLRKIRISDESAVVLEGRVGVKVFCKKDGRETCFRCILKPRDLEGLCGALARISTTHNVNEFLRSSIIGSPLSATSGDVSSQHIFGGEREQRLNSSGGAVSAFKAISSVRATWSMQRAVDREDRLMTKALIRKRWGPFVRSYRIDILTFDCSTDWCSDRKTVHKYITKRMISFDLSSITYFLQ